MSVEDDLQIIAEQEARLAFSQFDSDTVWELGCRLREAARQRGAALAIVITVNQVRRFQLLMAGASANNEGWARRKHNVVQTFERSALAIGLDCQRQKTNRQEKNGLSLAEHATHGGGFPLLLQGVGCIGSIVVSGLPQR
ncbi:heme-degrading domain-containing protein, partial [Pseudomonas sp. MWU12-2115]|uniref:heme-degrading domain-containing protein n=1 Tax=Pseudomonas sp. MWU12-2115 TaxID=2071713 RepID=UPI000DD99582